VSEYRDPIFQKLIDLLEAEGPEELVGHYVQGDVLRPAKESLPLVTVGKSTTRVGAASNMEDDQLMAVQLNIIYDYMQDLEQSSDLEVGLTSLYGMCEGRDETTYELSENTIMYVLRKHPKLDNDLYISVGPNEEVQIEYGMGIQRRGPGIFSVEAIIKFNLRFQQLRPGVV
jgi:hypothetical protein